MTSNIPLSDIPGWLWVVLGLTAAVQFTLEIGALVVLLRTPDERLVFGKKWPWVLIILLVNFVGAIVFFVAGRTVAPAAEPTGAGPAEASDRAVRAADVLYGPRNDGEQQ